MAKTRVVHLRFPAGRLICLKNLWGIIVHKSFKWQFINAFVSEKVMIVTGKI